jgi:hypothetical protein
MREAEECQRRRKKDELQKTEERIGKSQRKGQEEYLESICDEILEFQRTGHVHEDKGTRLERKSGHSNTDIVHTQGDQRRILKLCENCIVELYD